MYQMHSDIYILIKQLSIATTCFDKRKRVNKEVQFVINQFI